MRTAAAEVTWEDLAAAGDTKQRKMDMNPQESIAPSRLVERCQKVMAHAWMVRTFIKHSSEVEEFPELMEVARTVFDVSRALEARLQDPRGYFNVLRKKISRLREAASQFRTEASLASTHTNFQQAILSLDACVEELEHALSVAAVSSPLEEDTAENA